MSGEENHGRGDNLLLFHGSLHLDNLIPQDAI